MDVQALISNLTARGIALLPDGDGLIARPRSRLTDPDRLAIRQNKAALLARLTDEHERAEIARLDAERHAADRAARRGYDVDCTHTDHAEFLARTGQHCACQDSPAWWPPPAHSIVATCQRYGVALRIDPDGALVIGKAGAKAEEPTQPWPSLIRAMEAHLEAVAQLIASGRTLQAHFPEGEAA